MVLGSGCFDGLHAGHAAYLRALRGYAAPGEALMVAVAPDEYVRCWKNRQPYWPLADRLSVLALIPWIDRLLVHDSNGAANLIRREQPRVFVKGADWLQHGGVPEDVAAACAAVSATIVYVDEQPTEHTSDVSEIAW